MFYGCTMLKMFNIKLLKFGVPNKACDVGEDEIAMEPKYKVTKEKSQVAAEGENLEVKESRLLVE